MGDIDTKKLSLEVLLKQRETLVLEISEYVKTFHTYCFTVLGIAAGAISLFITEIVTLTPELLFLLTQVIFLASLLLMGLFSSMNNNRDYVRAIDRYLSEKYDVHTLFYQGEISYQHINKYGSSFTDLTTMGSVTLVLCFVALTFVYYSSILSIIFNYPIYCAVVFIEIVFFARIEYGIIKYKTGEKSRYFNDVYTHLSNIDAESNTVSGD